jgi:hypothetical protein
MQISCEACLHYSKIRVRHIAISSFSRLRIGHDRLC